MNEYISRNNEELVAKKIVEAVYNLHKKPRPRIALKEYMKLVFVMN